MLLEAYHLLKNRIGQGQSNPQSHESLEFKNSRASLTWRLVLNLDGSEHAIEPMGDAESAGYWSLQKGTSAIEERFPALRPKPLLVLDVADARWDKIEKITEQNLSEVIALLKEMARPSPEGLRRISVDLSVAWKSKAAPILEWQIPSDADLLVYLKQCVQAFGKFTGHIGSERNDVNLPQRSPRTAVVDILVTQFAGKLQPSATKILVKAIAETLLGVRKKEKGKQVIKAKAQFCIDLNLPDQFGMTIYTLRMRNLVLSYLGTADSCDEMSGICSVSGKTAPLLKSKFPVWSTPVFQTSPYSKFRAAPCNQRYGRFDLEGLQISADLARNLVGGLNAQTDAKKEWKTWARIHNGQFQKQEGKPPRPLHDLMLAYPSFADDDLVTINAFVRPEIDDSAAANDQAKGFSDCAEQLLKGLKKKSNSELIDRDTMHIMVVRKLNKGQTQLSYAASPGIREFVSALEIWSRSANNLPTGLSVPLPTKKSATEFRWRTPRLLFPEEISRLLTQQWTRDGSESTMIQGPSVGMVLDLFLRKQGVWEAAAMRLLELTLIRSDALLIGASHILHRDGPASIVNWTKFVTKAQSGKVKRQPDYALAQTLSLLGSLLYIMNSTVQTYTNESAYLVGKLLAMMDELHRCYCVAERKGDIPNSLIGNSLLGRAADSPAMALAELCERGRIYMGWAKTASVRDGVGDSHQIAVNSARKLLRLAQPIADQLHASDDLAVELSAIRKAHLFLGYLSPTLGKDDGKGPVTGGDPLAIPAATKIEDVPTKETK